MTVNTAWTNPATLDKAVGAIVPSADYNELQSDVNYLGGSDGNTGPAPVGNTTTPYTITTERFYEPEGATPTVHLPATPTAGRRIDVKHCGSGTCTIDVSGGASIIWGTAPVASLTLAVGDAYSFVGNGTYWRIYG